MQRNLYAYCSGNPVMYTDPSGHYKQVQQGSRGEDVKTLQKLLNAHGANLAVDGDFGPLTKAAVVSYQRSTGTLLVDGIAGKNTWESLLSSQPSSGGSLTAGINSNSENNDVGKNAFSSGGGSSWGSNNKNSNKSIAEIFQLLIGFQYKTSLTTKEPPPTMDFSFNPISIEVGSKQTIYTQIKGTEKPITYSMTYDKCNGLPNPSIGSTLKIGNISSEGSISLEGSGTSITFTQGNSRSSYQVVQSAIGFSYIHSVGTITDNTQLVNYTKFNINYPKAAALVIVIVSLPQAAPILAPIYAYAQQ
jgi:peptidoglycan hydrolase-like protein with peptidoglycan-binding domain